MAGTNNLGRQSRVFGAEESCYLHEVIAYTIRYATLMRGCPRYLTKLCNNIVALVSPEDYSKIVWHDDQEKSMEEAQMMGDDLDISGRFMSFEVVKTSEQEENITAQFGFTVCTSLLYRNPSFLID